MKNSHTNSHTYTLTAIAAVSVAITSCDTMNEPLGGSSYNPLDAPGGMSSQQDPYGPLYSPGSFLQTVSPSTALFNKFPGIEDQPDKILPDYTDVKVISTKGSYVKVEVVNTGEVGFVPSVMLGEKRSPNEVPVTPGVGEVLLTPDIDPAAGTAPVVPDLPAVAPDPEDPGIEPPQVVDPSKPAE